MKFLWGIKNPKWPSFLMEKVKYLRFEQRHHLHGSDPRPIDSVWVCVCVSKRHSLFQFRYNSFKYLLLECKLCWKLRSLLWKKQTITYHGCRGSVEYPSPPWRNKRIRLYKQVTVLNYKSEKKKKYPKPADCWLNCSLAMCELKFCRSSKKQEQY